MGSEEPASHDETEAEIRRLLSQPGDPWPAIQHAARAWGPALADYIARRGLAPHDVNDILSDTWLAAHESAGRFDRSRSFRGWIFTIAKHRMHRRFRDAGRDVRRLSPLSQVDQQHLAAAVQSSIIIWQRTDVKRGLLALRDELGQDDQHLIELRADHRLEWVDVVRVFDPDGAELEGDELKKRVNTLTQRYKRLKQRLHRMATDRGLLPETSR
ncbi:MAG: sigma-70 family RNA polymerase sigma factor [Deltaproteobacteria bacterium]|nr:sigma-70 family RNA polymerase sigma factor [Deltaproteobacteria bacterium]